jgi:protein TonB
LHFFIDPRAPNLVPVFHMKRFLIISILLHAGALLLLFSWENPLADRLLARSVVEVSLVEGIEGKPVGKKEGGDKKPEKKSFQKEDIQEKKEAGVTRQVARAKEELKIEEPKPEKTEPVQKEIREEKPKVEETMPSEPPVLMARPEEIPPIQAGLNPLAGGSGEISGSANPLKGSPTSGGRGDGGAVFLASAAPESGREGIALGGGGKGSGAGQEEGGTSRFSSVPKSSGDGDSIIAEIMRRIEKAKRYPRMARKMGTEGQAAVRFRIKADGKVEGVELMESSGSEILDQASLETVQRAAPLPYKEGWLKVVIIFKIL